MANNYTIAYNISDRIYIKPRNVLNDTIFGYNRILSIIESVYTIVMTSHRLCGVAAPIARPVSWHPSSVRCHGTSSSVRYHGTHCPSGVRAPHRPSDFIAPHRPSSVMSPYRPSGVITPRRPSGVVAPHRSSSRMSLSGQNDGSTSSKMLAWGFSCNIHSQHTEKRGRQDRMVPLSVPLQLPTTTITPPTLTNEEVGEESMVEEPQKTQSHSHSFSLRSRPVILGGITNRMQGLKFN